MAFYAVFASGELQPWAEPPKEEDPALLPQPAIAPPPTGPWNPFDQQKGVAAYNGTDPNAYSTVYIIDYQSCFEISLVYSTDFYDFQETTPAFQSSTNPFNGRLHSYGATDGTTPAPPYSTGSAYPTDYTSSAQPVQPAAQDAYMYGNVQERNY